jgi:hypothetical protein
LRAVGSLGETARAEAQRENEKCRENLELPFGFHLSLQCYAPSDAMLRYEDAYSFPRL